MKSTKLFVSIAVLCLLVLVAFTAAQGKGRGGSDGKRSGNRGGSDNQGPPNRGGSDNRGGDNNRNRNDNNKDRRGHDRNQHGNNDRNRGDHDRNRRDHDRHRGPTRRGPHRRGPTRDRFRFLTYQRLRYLRDISGRRCMAAYDGCNICYRWCVPGSISCQSWECTENYCPYNDSPPRCIQWRA